MTISSILPPLEIFNGHLVFFVLNWYILPVLLFCSNKNLATLDQTTVQEISDLLPEFLTKLNTQPLNVLVSQAEVPDFSWHKIPKREKYTKMTTKYTKCP
jgi:hypothetical protein